MKQLAKSNDVRGGVSGDVIYLWVTGIPQKEFVIALSIAEIDEQLNIWGNSHYAIWKLAEASLDKETERWIESTKDIQLRNERHRCYHLHPDFCKGSPRHSLQIDDISRCIKALYETITGRKPMSLFERVTCEVKRKQEPQS